MTYPVSTLLYSTTRDARDQIETLETIGGNLLRVDTGVDAGESINLRHVVDADGFTDLRAHYRDNVNTTFTINFPSEPLAVRYVAPPRVVSKNGAWYSVSVEVARVL